ncbi:MAG: sugar 3,4-ketoisomerase [Aeoliella sp.]
MMRQPPLSQSNHVPFRATRQSAIAGVRFLSLKEVRDSRGTLTVCQWNEQLPFTPRRVFFCHTVPNEDVRGEHAHKECDQVLVCFNGSVEVLVDDGAQQEEHLLDASTDGLLVPAGIWASQYRYSPHATLAVFASHDYDADDYIRNYDEFLAYRRSICDTAA